MTGPQASAPDVAPDGMPEADPAPANPFAALAHQRKVQGLTLEDIAQHLKFAPRQIEALEAGNFAQLPAGMFARGMLRGYARLLKLDAAPMLAALGEHANAVLPPEQAVVMRDPTPFADATRRVNLAYIVVSLGVLVAVAALAFEWLRDGAGAVKLAFVPAALTPPAPQTMVSSIAPTPVIAAAEIPPQAELGPLSPPAPAGGQHRINLSFGRASWVHITDRAGRTLLSQLNPAGSEQAIEGLPPFDLVVGNAQHVKLIYDDRLIDLMQHVKVEVARFTLE